MINVATASFIATVDDDYNDEGQRIVTGRIHLGGELIWESVISYDTDADEVMKRFAYKLSGLF